MLPGEVTILFSDIVGFTTLASRVPIEKVIAASLFPSASTALSGCLDRVAPQSPACMLSICACGGTKCNKPPVLYHVNA